MNQAQPGDRLDVGVGQGNYLANSRKEWERVRRATRLFQQSAAAHMEWEQVKEAALRIHNKAETDRPWKAGSVFQTTLRDLKDFESNLRESHRGRNGEKLKGNLRRWERRGLKREFAVFRMKVELCHVVLRKRYFHEMLQNERERAELPAIQVTTAPRKRVRGPPRDFWMEMAHSLFFHASLLQEHVLHIHEVYLDEAHLENGRGYPPMFAFCLWQACSLSIYLWMHPELNQISAATPRIDLQREVNLEDYLRMDVLDQGANMRAQNCFEILSYVTRGRVAPFVLANQEDDALLEKMTNAVTDYQRGIVVGGQTPKHFWLDLMTGMSWVRRARYGLLSGAINASEDRLGADEDGLVKKVFQMEMEAEREGEFDCFLDLPPMWFSDPSEESL